MMNKTRTRELDSSVPMLRSETVPCEHPNELSVKGNHYLLNMELFNGTVTKREPNMREM
jgi:hypothetical protein